MRLALQSSRRLCNALRLARLDTMNHHGRHRLLQLALIGLALRAIAPAGYMPAPIADGLPFVLCPGGIGAVAFVAAADRAGHHHDDGHARSDESAHDAIAWKFCPFAVLFASPGPVAEHAALPAVPTADPPPFPPERKALTFLAHSWGARAPPNSRLADDRSSA
ncbi:MAG TPA: hypothetical protein VFG91_12000 [Woeseiaceae bacterium]|nr:hypothetical protein [Woeseiaceae bacterium]